MMNLTATLPPVSAARDVQSLLELVTLLSDPKATAKRISDFAQAADGARQIIDQAAADRSAVDQHKTGTEAALEKLGAELRAKLDEDRNEFQARVAAKEAELAAREKRSKELLDKAAADAAQAAADKAEAARRLRALEGAA